MKKAAIATFLILVLLMGCASGPVTAPPEPSYITKAFGEITFEYNERFSYSWNEEIIALTIDFVPYHNASVWLIETPLPANLLSQDFANILLGMLPITFSPNFEDRSAGDITETIVNGKIAFEKRVDLLNGSGIFNGNFKVDIIIFAGVNTIYTVFYVASIDMHNTYYQQFRDIVASIRTYD